ncbi:Cro/CI family transcriptional regulator [Pseudomonas aeruginosa]|nr:Cro/CI family transcriptional regulator [Pseudomonas aeruginosa]
MKTVTLIEYLAEHGTQADLAKGLGVQQSAISQMLRAKRNITITIRDDGSWRLLKRGRSRRARPLPDPDQSTGREASHDRIHANPDLWDLVGDGLLPGRHLVEEELQ